MVLHGKIKMVMPIFFDNVEEIFCNYVDNAFKADYKFSLNQEILLKNRN